MLRKCLSILLLFSALGVLLGHEVMPHKHHHHDKHSHHHHDDDQDSHQSPFSHYFHDNGGVTYTLKTADTYKFQQTTNHVAILIEISQCIYPVIKTLTLRRPPSSNLQPFFSFINSSGKLRGPPNFIV